MIKTLCNNQQLTGTAADSLIAQTQGLDQHTLYINYSPDTNDTNALEVRIYTSMDGTNYHQFSGAYSASTGTITPGDPVVLSFGSDGTTDQLEVPYSFNVPAHFLKVTVVETNTPGDYGNVTITLVSSNA